MADLTLRDLASQKGYNVAYDNNTKNVSISNPLTGKSVSFANGQGADYGMSGAINGVNMVSDSSKLISALDISADKQYANPANKAQQDTTRSDSLNNILSGLNDKSNNYYNSLTSNEDLRTQRTSQVNDMYDNLLQSQLTSAQLGRQQQEQTLNQQKYDSDLNYNNLLGQLNQEKSQATPQYQNLKSQQFKTTLDDIKKINENMASRGQYFSGANEQVQSDQRVANESAMNQIGLQEQQLYDDINRRATEAYNIKANEIKKIDENIQLMKDQGASADSAIVQALQAQKIQSNIDLENVLQARELQIAQLQQDAENNRIGNVLNVIGQQETIDQNKQNNAYQMADITGKYISPSQQSIIDGGVSDEDRARIGNIVRSMNGGYQEYMNQLDPSSDEYTKSAMLRNEKLLNNSDLKAKYGMSNYGIQTEASKSNELNRQALVEDITTKRTQNQYLSRQLEANLEGAKLQNIGQNLANQISQVNLSYLPQEKQMAIQTAQVQLQNGQLQNAYQTIVNAGLPAKLTAELEGMYANTLQTNVETEIATNQATGSGATKNVINYAMKYLGTKYVYGGNSLTKGIDCSGLTQQAFKQYGINLPRTSFEQAKTGKAVSKGDLQAGDLVFFNTTGKDYSHVGIYIGNGQFINAQSSKGIAIASLSDKYWSSKYQTARRVTK
jgi:cell wall-associated NlpC family hydrolase